MDCLGVACCMAELGAAVTVAIIFWQQIMYRAPRSRICTEDLILKPNKCNR